MFNLFGAKPKPLENKPQSSAPSRPAKPSGNSASGGGSNDVLSQIASHNKHIESLEKRENHLQKKIDACVNEAKAKMAKNDKKGAMVQLQRKKMYEKEMETLAGSRFKLEQQQLAMESASVNSATIEALSKGNQAMQRQRQANNIDEDTVVDTMDALNEEMEINKEISEALAGGVDDVLEDEDLLDELAALQMEDTVEANAPTAATTTTKQPANNNSVFNLPSAPDAAPVVATAAAAEEDEEEKQLRELQASMGL
jgi:charged multivesicular body protein 4A/B